PPAQDVLHVTILVIILSVKLDHRGCGGVQHSPLEDSPARRVHVRGYVDDCRFPDGSQQLNCEDEAEDKKMCRFQSAGSITSFFVMLKFPGGGSAARLSHNALVRAILGTIVRGLSTVALVYATIQAGTDNSSLTVSATPSESPLGHIQKSPLDITRVQSPQMERPSYRPRYSTLC